MKKWRFEWFRGTLPPYFGLAIFLFTGTTKVKSKYWHIGRLCFGYTIQDLIKPTQYVTRAPQTGTDADHCPCDSCEVYREFLVKTYGKEVYVAHNPQREAEGKFGKIHTYGFGGTIHGTKHLDIEVDRTTGDVVSVWFRCCALPFKVSVVDMDRSVEMEQMSERINKEMELHAVTIIQTQEADRG